MIKKISVIGLIVAFVGAFIFFSQLDQELSKESLDLMSRIEEGGESESYIYLLGMDAAKGEDPAIAGARFFEELRKQEAGEPHVVDEYVDSKKLALPSEDVFCRTWEENCLETMFYENSQADNLMAEHDVLVSRYKRFLEFNEYKTLAKPTLSEVFPPYQYVSIAERIKLLNAVSIYRNGDTEKAISLLVVQLSKLRKSMELQDNLRGKLVFLIKIFEVIDVLSIIHSNEGLQSALIPALSASEKSFYMVFAREFSIDSHKFKNLDNRPYFFELVGMPEQVGRAPTWVTRMLFKPNMTINAVALGYYARLEELAQLSPADFAKRVEDQEDTDVSTSFFRNSVGKALLSMLPQNTHDRYVARFAYLDIKISLFNQIHHYGRDINQITNPYYGKEIPEKNNGKLCLSGPLEDKRSLRCLAIELAPPAQ